MKRHDTRLTRQLGKHLHRAVVGTHHLAETVTRLDRFVKRAARVLGQDKNTSDEVEGDFDLLLERIRTRLRQPKVSPRVAPGPLGSVPGVARR